METDLTLASSGLDSAQMLADEISWKGFQVFFRNKNEISQWTKLLSRCCVVLLLSEIKVPKIDCKLISTEAEKVDYEIK